MSTSPTYSLSCFVLAVLTNLLLFGCRSDESSQKSPDYHESYLLLYAFSQENWNRPQDEVSAIMELLEHYLQNETDELVEKGIRIDAIGRIDELSPAIQRDIARLIEKTEGNDEMRVTFARSYSGRAEIVDAIRGILREVESGLLDPEAIDEKTVQTQLYRPDLPDPDLLIRTGDENRVSNFLLWQVAYAELYVTETLWPDFGPDQLLEAVRVYQQRERRFGLTSAQIRSGRCRASRYSAPPARSALRCCS